MYEYHCQGSYKNNSTVITQKEAQKCINATKSPEANCINPKNNSILFTIPLGQQSKFVFGL